MEQYLLAFVFFVAAFVFMGSSLHFSKYKRRGTGCCSQGIEHSREDLRGAHQCRSCDRKKMKP